MANQYAFYFLSFVSIMSALMVVFSKNPVYSVLFLIITFFSIAGHYFLLNAQFLAMVHIIVYAGAIMVLFLYVIMMLNLNKEDEPNKPLLSKVAASVSGGVLLLVLVAALKGATLTGADMAASQGIGTVEVLGKKLFDAQNGFLYRLRLARCCF